MLRREIAKDFNTILRERSVNPSFEKTKMDKNFEFIDSIFGNISILYL